MTIGVGKIEITCACGKSFLDYASNYRKFCSRGCARSAGARTHGESRTRLYNTWSGMKSRCYCRTSIGFDYYGGRGIGVFHEWRDSFSAFRSWAMSSGYSDALEIDRIDNDRDYEPGNCRWATRVNQMRNTRKRSDAKTSKFKGVSWCSNVGKWRAQISLNGKTTHVGLYPTEIRAALGYDRAAAKHYGEFANLNFKEGVQPF